MLYAKLIGRIALFTCEIIAHIEFYLQGLLPKILAIYTINNYTVIQHEKRILDDSVVSAAGFVPKLRRKMCKISIAIFANGFTVLFSALALPVLYQ